MAFKEVVLLDSSNTIALGGVDKNTNKPNPTSITGYYMGSEERQGNYGPFKLHKFQTTKGLVGIYGKADMNKKLGQVPIGTQTTVTDTGKTERGPKGNTKRIFKVQQDAEDTIEVQSSNANPGSESFDEGDTYEHDHSESYGSGEDAEIDDVPVAPARTKAAAMDADMRAKKVQELMNKNKQR